MAVFINKKPGDSPPEPGITLPTIIDQTVHASSLLLSAHHEALDKAREAIAEADRTRSSAQEAHNVTCKMLQDMKAAQASAVARAEEALEQAKGKAKKDVQVQDAPPVAVRCHTVPLSGRAVTRGGGA